MNHTRGEWGFADNHEVCAIDSDQLNNGYVIAVCEGPDKIKNAARIVACVNACNGIDTEIIALNANKVSVLLDQRDELLSALKKVFATPIDSYYTSGLNAEIANLIAKCEAQS